MIAIVDYGMGNLGSIANMIKKAGGQSKIISNPEELFDANAIILPGVGAFDNGMSQLKNLGFIDIINRKVKEDKVPLLGICLGMQLMTQMSEEGTMDGLGLINARTLKFRLPDDFRVPHMGWNYVNSSKSSQINKDFDLSYKYYFVHSYYVECQNDNDILLTSNYNENFCSAFQKDNIIGVQFHPEKSHKFGLKLFKNFLETIKDVNE